MPYVNEGTYRFNSSNIFNVEIPIWLDIIIYLIAAVIFINLVSKVYKTVVNDVFSRSVSGLAVVLEKRNVNDEEKGRKKYYMTFRRVNSGEIIDLSVPQDIYFTTLKNDIGTVRYKGERFLSFTSSSK